MKIHLAYGSEGISVEVPEKNLKKILTMNTTSELDDPFKTIQEQLEVPEGTPPLMDLARNKKSAVIVVCDVTRPVPNSLILPPILKTLERAGLSKENITLLIATGLHRPNLGDELRRMVGDEVYKSYRIVNHYARDSSSLTDLGETTTGTPVHINLLYYEADLKITTGFIEPHIFAGFSGGRKLICPGIAGEQTIKRNHSPGFLEKHECREGSLMENPLHLELLEIAAISGCDFIINVALNEQRKITGVFAGDMIQAHHTGVDFVKHSVRCTVAEPADIVITTSAGYPLDASFYQSIKGLTAALPVVKTGGTIIMAASCSEGLGDSSFTAMIRQYPEMNRFLDVILNTGEVLINQWQYEELGKVLRKTDVYLYSEGIPEADRTRLPVTMVRTVEEGIAKAITKHGTDASIVVIPKGPYILADCESK
ncbi:MAG: nickel-dependent lactate racemase [Patescibacteria group bacterium]|nr:nickel-dependent lactate racemase [Patescibacteria group bacterium]